MVNATQNATTEDHPGAGPAPDLDMVWIPGGTFMMGSDHHYPEEAPAHPVTVDGFWIDRSQVTNIKFRRFVQATGYVTVAERVPTWRNTPAPQPEDLVAGSVVFTPPPGPVPMDDHYAWWHWQPGADWRHPEGPGSDLKGRDKHPVVHVAWEDVEAYAAWAGKTLPTEAEWEFAARGGHDGWAFAWGEELAPKGKMLANYWQGEFPWQNLELDGFARTAPVGSFPPNDYGLFDMIGNAWEWTTDWYAGHGEVPRSCCSAPSSIRAALGASRASIRTRPGARLRARCSRADRLPARRTTASDIVRPRACITRSIPAPITSASAASFARRRITVD